MAAKKKHVVLCVDDFGQNEKINRAVFLLARERRISATSCLTQGLAWPAGAPGLRGLDIDVGLHINFTEALGARPHFHRPLPRLIIGAWLRQLEPSVLVSGIEQQCDLFELHMKREPDFFDGHQHVHQFPQVRDALMDVLARRYDCDDVWVRSTALRNTSPAAGVQLKARLIALLGSGALRRRLYHGGVPYNDDFAGIYNFAGGGARFAALMKKWLAYVGEGAVIMCHPADEADPADAIGHQRVAEFEFLKSDAFRALLGELGCRVARLQT